tara:strand:- start:2285 stop:2674 length:390 start_codon:yes stop_codon:yes gene_type:complete
MTVTPRLDLDEEILKKAKKMIARLNGDDPENKNLEKIHFSQTAQTALDRHEATIVEHLELGGLRKQNVERGRPRRLRDEFWNHLGQRAKEFDVSRIGFLRAALALLAAEYDDEVQTPATDNNNESSQSA